MIIFACWLILLALDILICAGLRLFFGIPFAKALLWGMTSLLLPPCIDCLRYLYREKLFQSQGGDNCI